MKTKNMTILHLKRSIGRSPWRFGSLLIPLMLVCLSFTPIARAVNPPPDGGYGGQNTAEGTDALFSLTSGVWNVAVGFQALHSDTTGTQNTATGYRALFTNTTGSKSTAYGSQALYNNTVGNANVATGFNTLFSNTSGNQNTGNGYRTLAFNNGDDNTATGFNGLYNNRTGVENTATGSQALFHNFGANNNTGTGFQALFNNATGSGNIALGNQAGINLTVGNNNIDIGNSGVAAESGIIRIGTDGTHTNTFLAGAVNLNGSLVLQGEIQVPGANIGTNKAVFIHRATAANSVSDYTIITHPMSDGDPNAILLVTPNWNPGGTPPDVYNNHPIGVFYFGGAAGHWAIFNQDLTAIPLNAAFNVMIVKP
jgi:hypothetical protein